METCADGAASHAKKRGEMLYVKRAYASLTDILRSY